ncbi:hypothetical protein BH10PSE11_BH10PSE11_40130 [soil metagenome]
MYHTMPEKVIKSSFLRTSLLMAALLWPALAPAAELLMYERSGCVWCARWDRDVGPVYSRTDEGKVLPLRRINIDRSSADGTKLASPVLYTPTFVVSDNGREVGRITGYINDNSFWGLLGVLLTKVGHDAQPDHSLAMISQTEPHQAP